MVIQLVENNFLEELSVADLGDTTANYAPDRTFG
jgi:hypothetical protein